MFDVYVTILHMHETLGHWRRPGRFVIEIWVFIKWSHPNIPHSHTTMLDAHPTIFRFWVSRGPIFRGAFFRGPIFRGSIFRGPFFGDHFSGIPGWPTRVKGLFCHLLYIFSSIIYFYLLNVLLSIIYSIIYYLSSHGLSILLFIIYIIYYLFVTVPVSLSLYIIKRSRCRRVQKSREGGRRGWAVGTRVGRNSGILKSKLLCRSSPRVISDNYVNNSVISKETCKSTTWQPGSYYVVFNWDKWGYSTDGELRSWLRTRVRI